MKRIVGIDFGLARFGLAITDPMQIIATPFGCIETKGLSDEQKIKKIEHALSSYKHEIERIVIGLPLEKNGKEGDMALLVRQFAALLAPFFSCPIDFFDERLTSKQAMRSLKEQGLKRKKASRLKDQTAACLMLQNFLQTICT